MPQSITTAITGLSGVFIVMTFLLIFVTLSSKLAIALERKQKTEKQN